MTVRKGHAPALHSANMYPTDETEIELSKAKMALMALGATAFVAAGIWMLTLDSNDIRAGKSFRLFFNSPAFTYSLGAAAIVVFGGFGVLIARKFFDYRAGLVLNSEGIVDNTSIASPGFIPWSEITGFQVFEMSGQKMLIVLLTDPEKYANRGNSLKRALNKANANMSGSPIYISANSLEIAFPELISLFEMYLEKYRLRRLTAGPETKKGVSRETPKR